MPFKDGLICLGTQYVHDFNLQKPLELAVEAFQEDHKEKAKEDESEDRME